MKKLGFAIMLISTVIYGINWSLYPPMLPRGIAFILYLIIMWVGYAFVKLEERQENKKRFKK